MSLRYGDLLMPRWYTLNHTYRYRMDPVPGTSARRYKFLRYRNTTGFKLRHMDTAQWLPWQEDTEAPVKYLNAKRQEVWDSDPWGECPRSIRGNECWKRHKKARQWA